MDKIDDLKEEKRQCEENINKLEQIMKDYEEKYSKLIERQLNYTNLIESSRIVDRIIHRNSFKEINMNIELLKKQSEAIKTVILDLQQKIEDERCKIKIIEDKEAVYKENSRTDETLAMPARRVTIEEIEEVTKGASKTIREGAINAVTSPEEEKIQDGQTHADE